jgi:hypothetical protein
MHYIEALNHTPFFYYVNRGPGPTGTRKTMGSDVGETRVLNERGLRSSLLELGTNRN